MNDVKNINKNYLPLVCAILIVLAITNVLAWSEFAYCEDNLVYMRTFTYSRGFDSETEANAYAQSFVDTQRQLKRRYDVVKVDDDIMYLTMYEVCFDSLEKVSKWYVTGTIKCFSYITDSNHRILITYLGVLDLLVVILCLAPYLKTKQIKGEK